MVDERASGGPSEAELQQMLAEMREAPAEQVLVEVVNLLLQAAQVKLGRSDARLLIDAVAALAESAEGRADATLLAQVSQAVTQLRLAQVEAEGAAAPGSASVGEPAPEAAPPAPTPQPTAQPSPPSSQGSRLWVPGR